MICDEVRKGLVKKILVGLFFYLMELDMVEEVSIYLLKFIVKF